MRFLVQIPVKHVTGTQTYVIEAPTEEIALNAVRSGGGDIYSEELEVESLYWSDADVIPE